MSEVKVFIPDEEPNSGLPEADVLARLERKFFLRLLNTVEQYYDSQSDGVDVVDCVNGLITDLATLSTSNELDRLTKFARMFNRALSAGPGED